MKLNWKKPNEFPIWYVDSLIDPENDNPILRIELTANGLNGETYLIEILGVRKRFILVASPHEAMLAAESMLFEFTSLILALGI